MKTFTLILIAFFISVEVIAQSPQSFRYQAVAHDNSGNVLANQPVCFQISILSGSVAGTAVYSETHTGLITNIFGLVELEIGKGTPVTGTFSSINWGDNSYFVKVEMDPAGGSVYQTLSTSQLLSVPYALYSQNAGNGFSGDYDDLTNKPLLFDGAWSSLTGKPNTLSGYGITDGMNTSHPANGITSGLLSNWNTAYSWGNHEGLYKPLSYQPLWTEITSVPAGFADGIDNVDDIDNNITNEIQVLSISGNDLSLSKSGGTVTIPGDNWGTQVVVSDATLSGSGTTSQPLNIADNAVTSAKIADGTITSADLGSNSVTSAKISDGTIVAADIASNAISTAKVANSAVTGDKIADGTITGAKIAQQSAVSGQVLKWDGATWKPASDETGIESNPFFSSGGITRNRFLTDHFVFGSTSLDDVEGSDDNKRMFFNKSKGAFRAGESYTTSWDDANVGLNSTAFGEGPVASGIVSFAAGRFAVASGIYSTALGAGTYAIGMASTAFGGATKAMGETSTSFGFQTIAGAKSSVAIGQYNIGAGSGSSWVETDPVFEIGIGISDTEKANALTVLKNGNVGIGPANPSAKLEVGGQVKITGGSPATGKVLTSDASGLASWQTSPAGPFTSSGGITSNSPLTDHFVFGSPFLNDIAGSDDNIRMYFNKSKGVFRAGEAYATDWDEANAGDYSVAMGYKTKATGKYSSAFGSSNTAAGWYCTSMGYGTLANAINSVAIGKYNVGLGNPNTWVSEDPVFEIGIGAAQVERQNALTVLKNGNVGIGPSSPEALLHVQGNDIGEGNVLFSGSYKTTPGDPPSAGQGTRMMWYPDKAAFRAGFAGGGQWDKDNMGYFSVAFGNNTKASGQYASASGCATTASGMFSTAMGFSTTAPSYCETVLGNFNTDYTPAGQNSWNEADRLFVIGNGTPATSKSNALTILKNGNVGIGQDNPTVKLEVDGQVKITGGNPGSGKVLTSDAVGLTSWQTLSSNPWVSSGSNIYYNNGMVGIGTASPVALLHAEGTATGQGNVVFKGQYKSTAPGDPPVSGAGTRMMWYPDQAAFRAGYVDGAQWDKSYTGTFSTAFGHSTVASGKYSTALGYATTASGNHSLARGEFTTASGTHATASGLSVLASGILSTAIGVQITAPSYLETVFGTYNTGYTPASTTTWTETDRLFVVGNGSSSARRNAVTVLKNGNTGIGTDNPSANFEVNGQVKITGGNPGSGKALISDANGLAAWQSIAPWLHNGNDIYLFPGNLGLGHISPQAKLDVSASQGPNIIIRDSDGGAGRPGIQFVNNYIHYIAGDDSDNEIFGFYSGYGSTRTFGARLNVHGPASGNWGKYIGFRHDGNHGRIDTDAGYLVLEPAGNRVGVGTDAPTQNLDVNGTLRVRSIPSGATAGALYRTSDGSIIISSSDARLKENIKPINNSLEKVMQLRGVSFTWKTNPEYGTRIGFVAQEFEKVIPELVFTNEVDGYKGIYYAEVTAVLVEAIKDLKAENDLLKQRLEKIEALMEYKAEK
jgi:ribosomal protein S6E (S10)